MKTPDSRNHEILEGDIVLIPCTVVRALPGSAGVNNKNLMLRPRGPTGTPVQHLPQFNVSGLSVFLAIDDGPTGSVPRALEEGEDIPRGDDQAAPPTGELTDAERADLDGIGADSDDTLGGGEGNTGSATDVDGVLDNTPPPKPKAHKEPAHKAPAKKK